MASQLLNPKVRNAELRAFAYMSAKFERGARTSIECILPLVINACAEFSGDQFDPQKIIEFVKNTYKLELPYFVVEGMIPDLREIGALKENKQLRIYICGDAPSARDIVDDVDFSIEDIDLVETRLEKFAKNRGLEKPYSTQRWGEALIQFFKSDDDRARPKPVNVQGAILTDASSIDDAIIAEFIQDENEQRSPVYLIIEKIFYGVLVAEFLTRIASTGDKLEYKNLEIYYDTTVLIRMLGISGTVLRSAAIQMHQMLQDLGCNTYYFTHTASEITSILEATATNLENIQFIHFETREALIRGETTRADILLAAQTFETKLGQLNIFEKRDVYKQQSSDTFQVDEIKFQAELKNTGLAVYRSGPAKEYDAKSLALIVRLRAGKVTTEVSNCRALFITHNQRFAQIAKRFLVSEGDIQPRFVGPIFTLSQITTLAWVVNELPFDPIRISKELIANCYKASIPQEGWDKTFWEMIEELPAADAKAAANSIVVQTAREIALKRSHGHSAVLRKVNIQEVWEEAEHQKENMRETALGEGYLAGATAKSREVERHKEGRAIQIANTFTKPILWIIFFIFLILLAFVNIFAITIADSIAIRALVSFVSFVFCVITLNSIFGVIPKFDARGRIHRGIVIIIARLQNLVG